MSNITPVLEVFTEEQRQVDDESPWPVGAIIAVSKWSSGKEMMGFSFV